MNYEGPPLEQLTHRLAECPLEFLEEPRIVRQGVLHVDAVVSDLLRDLGGELLSASDATTLNGIDGTKKKRNRLSLVAVTSWLLHDPWFREQNCFAEQVKDLLLEGMEERAKIVRADRFVFDVERREELVRYVLKNLDLRPEGESKAQAQDRLTTVDSVERKRVLRKAKQAEKRAKELREKMARKAAEKAAAKVTRE